MKLTFDYYHNLEETELYLCNPDGRELFPLVGVNRKLTLRFNDLSELSFSCYSTTTASDGTIVDLDVYDYVQTRRLIFVTNVGWFVITSVNEQDDGVVKYKEVQCQSLQAVLKNRGFYCEEKVYYLYNPSDPFDSTYNPDDEESVPSVMGQLYQQLGIQQDLTRGIDDPPIPYDDWTITYVNDALTDKARNFKESTTYGYEWMAKDVADAFEVVILFDYFYKAIHIMLPSEATEKTNVIYSFSNFMKNIEIEEDAEDIVTVMNCNGNNCDIAGVNPTGTNYLCDFSYYMDDEGKWMSSALKNKINDWKEDVESARSNYEAKVLQLRTAYDSLASVKSILQEISQIYTDLSAAVARKSVAMSDNVALYGIVWAETVNMGEKSMDSASSVYSTALSPTKQITAYKDLPTFNESTRTWACSGASITGTIEYCYSYIDSNYDRYLYFIDASDNKSYCQLIGASKIDPSTYETIYACKGFKRYVDLDIANAWTKKYDSKRQTLKLLQESYERTIDSLKNDLQNITNELNILNYFSSTPELLKELQCYWIEGDYSNENIAVLEDTSQAEAIDLANELRNAGELELSKVCQPIIKFSLTSVDCTKQYEFRKQMTELELGKIITVEKEEGVWYYPALLEIELDLDSSDSFGLTFANSLRLDDWGYTYGDLVSDASSTSRQVSANWQNLVQYTKDKPALMPLIQDPLSSTLRAATANMTNQEFTINNQGILGRKFLDDTLSGFNDEQMRITNNVILFTDDNWDTIKVALGKVYYTDLDPESPTYGELISRYGLAGETIVGSLIMGNSLRILDTQGNDMFSVIDGKINAEADKISLIVSNVGSNGTVTAASIVSAVNNAGTTVKISADHVNLTGYVTVSSLGAGGTTSIDGSRITTGTISADRIDAANLTVHAADNASAIAIKSGNNTLFSASGSSVQIAGFRVDSNSLYSGSTFSNSDVFLCRGTSSSYTIAGKTQSGWGLKVGTNFGVDTSGNLYCTSAHLTGEIDATSGSIGNATNKWIIGSSSTNASIYNGMTSLDDTTHSGVYIGTDGIALGKGAFKVTPEGEITATKGTIGSTNNSNWTIGTNATYASLYNGTSSLAGTAGIGTATNRVYLGTDGLSFSGAANSATDYNAVMRASLFMIYGDTNASGNYNRATLIRSSSTGYYRTGTTKISTASTLGTAIGAIELGTTNNFVLLSGTWRSSSAISTNSDRRLKHEIEDMDSRYVTLFDALAPKRYKYNDGSSGRYHTGFVAQELKDAMVSAGLDSGELAALCIDDVDGENESWGIRYEELIAILAAKIKSLEARIAAHELNERE